MPPTTIHAAPPLDSFTALADHQAQTPTSFYGAKPVLYYHATGIRALAARSQLSKLPIFAAVVEGQADGTEEAEARANSVEVVEAFVSSE
jgi:chloride channel, nucleotide-sensitive, 1A